MTIEPTGIGDTVNSGTGTDPTRMTYAVRAIEKILASDNPSVEGRLSFKLAFVTFVSKCASFLWRGVDRMIVTTE